jgi:5'-nucleotidase
MHKYDSPVNALNKSYHGKKGFKNFFHIFAPCSTVNYKLFSNMKKKTPLIMITNDDGVDAEGLRRLTAALLGLGNIAVFAPDGPRSGMSCAITTAEPVKYHILRRETGLTVYSCTGTPVDCVKLAVSQILPHKPDLLFSGINHGDNLALSVHYSGTMGAAFEGCVFGIPSTGISLQGYTPGANFSESCRLARYLAVQILRHGLPRGTYLNLNIPNIPRVKGLCAARQTGGKWIREYKCETGETGETQYRLTGNYKKNGPDHPDNDITLLKNGYATLVPCQLDITDYAFLPELKSWNIKTKHNPITSQDIPLLKAYSQSPLP